MSESVLIEFTKDGSRIYPYTPAQIKSLVNAAYSMWAFFDPEDLPEDQQTAFDQLNYFVKPFSELITGTDD